jgi:hypothetical protein
VDWIIVNGEIVMEKGKLRDLGSGNYFNEKDLVNRHQEISNKLIRTAESNLGISLTKKINNTDKKGC